MADISVNIKGDSSGAQQAMRGVGEAAGDAAGGLDEAKDATKQLTEATEKSSESQAGAAIKFALVAKAVKEVVKFVGDSVKEYLSSANASKELTRVAKDLDNAQRDLKRSIGEAALELAKQAKLAEAAQGALGMLQTLLKGDTEENIGREQRMNELLAANAELRAARVKGAAAEIEAASKRVLAAQRAMGIAPGQSISADTELGAGAQAEAKAQAEARAKTLAELRDAQERHDAEMFQLAKKNADDLRKLMKDEDESELIEQKNKNKALLQELKLHQTGMWEEIDAADTKRQKLEDEAAKREAEAMKRHAAELEAQQQKWEQAGDAIGGAFVSALSSQLAQLAQGGEFDAALFVGNILAATIAVAGTAIGSAMGQPALGAALGNLAAMGVQAAAQGISAEDHKKKAALPKYHDGGWVDGGMEQIAVLRRNERVLTPEEVGRMGGASSVDSMAKGMGGAGGIAVTVQAIDAESAARGFERQLGIAFRRAAATGSGPLWRLSRSIA